MKPKSLIPLVIIVAVLVGLVAYKKTSQRPQTMLEQTKLVRLLPDGFSKADIARIELCSGDKSDEKLVLTFDKAADKWRVTNHFNAPAKKETVDKYLDAIAKMKGEPRTMGASETALADYNLTDAKAFHVAGFKEGGTEPMFQLLVGKSPSYKEIFVRKAGNNDVFVDDTNLKQQAGINDESARPSRPGQKEEKTEEKPLPKPEATTWLDKEIVKVDSAKLTKIALNLPDKSLVFERREKPKPPAPPENKDAAPAPPADEKPASPAGSSEAQPGGAPAITVTPSGTPAASAAPAAPDKPEYEWVLASGGTGLTLKPKSIDTFITRFSPLNATDVVDPAKKADWGLEKPAFACVLSVEGQPDIRIEGGRPSAKGDGYVRVADAKEDIVYSLAKYSFEQVFPKGTDFFDLPALTFDKKTIDGVNIAGPGGNIVLARSGETLSITQPVCDLKPTTASVDNIANTLAALRPADYADGDPGLGEATRSVTFTAAGQPHSIKIFADSKCIDGSYAKIDDKPEVLVLNKADIGKVFPTPNDLFERKLFELEADDITEIAVQSPARNFGAVQADDKWKLTVGSDTVDASAQACKDLAEAFATAQAADILFGKADLDAPADSSVRVKTKEGVEHTLSFAPEKDGKREIKVSGKNEIFAMATPLVDALFPDAEKMKQPAPPAAPAAPAPETAAAPTPPSAAPDASPAAAPAAPAVVTATPAPTPAEQPKPEVATPQPPAAPVVVQTTPPAEPAPAAAAPAPESK